MGQVNPDDLRRLQSGWSGSTSASAKSYRLTLMEVIIAKSRTALGHQPLDDRALTAVALTYLELLDGIPDDSLNECYRVAMREKTDTYPLSVVEMSNAWQQVCEERIRERRLRQAEYLALPRPYQQEYSFAEWKAMREKRQKLDVDALADELRGQVEGGEA